MSAIDITEPASSSVPSPAPTSPAPSSSQDGLERGVPTLDPRLLVCGQYSLVDVLRFVELLWNSLKVKRVKPHFDWRKIAEVLELEWTPVECEALWIALARNGLFACLASGSAATLEDAASHLDCLNDTRYLESCFLRYSDRKKPAIAKKRHLKRADFQASPAPFNSPSSSSLLASSSSNSVPTADFLPPIDQFSSEAAAAVAMASSSSSSSSSLSSTSLEPEVPAEHPASPLLPPLSSSLLPDLPANSSLLPTVEESIVEDQHNNVDEDEPSEDGEEREESEEEEEDRDNSHDVNDDELTFDERLSPNKRVSESSQSNPTKRSRAD